MHCCDLAANSGKTKTNYDLAGALALGFAGSDRRRRNSWAEWRGLRPAATIGPVRPPRSAVKRTRHDWRLVVARVVSGLVLLAASPKAAR